MKRDMSIGCVRAAGTDDSRKTTITCTTMHGVHQSCDENVLGPLTSIPDRASKDAEQSVPTTLSTWVSVEVSRCHEEVRHRRLDMIHEHRRLDMIHEHERRR